jgi:hypothetical protein
MDKYQEHLDSQPDDSRWDGFCRGDADQRDDDHGFFERLTFAQAAAQAKKYASHGIKHKVVRIADGCFEVVVLDHRHEY